MMRQQTHLRCVANETRRSSFRWRSLTVALSLVVICLPGYAAIGAEDISAEDSALRLRAANIDVDTYRSRGQEGLDELLALYQETEALLLADGDVESCRNNDELNLLTSKIDEVAAARDSHISGLFWHTDYDQALAEAESTNRPVLSLRMMGKLTDEYSCANSRFFRTALYANQEIAQFLKDNYVLHWHSVRPVPRVTIDFGDGRVLHRTLTGNSIHYIVSPDGLLLDALPGLYSPQMFLEYVQKGDQICEALADIPDAPEVIAQYHDMQRREILDKWELQMFTATVNRAHLNNNDVGDDAVAVDAVDAVPRAVGKGLVEVRLAEEVVMKRLDLLAQNSDEATWREIANFYRDGATLDERSRSIVARHMGCDCSGTNAEVAGNEDLARKIENFENAIALDTARNEFLMHTELHLWIANGEIPLDLVELDERVYDELFLTPSADPWIGLVPENVYAALEDEGIQAESSRE